MTRFAGYAAIFDRADRGGDIIRPGAFAASLAAGGPVPLLWQHDARRPAGVIDTIVEDAKGLRVIARADAPVAPGTGLSFGYRVRRAAAGTNRELHQLDLIEVSLVTNPMQPLARVHAVSRDPEAEGRNDDGL